MAQQGHVFKLKGNGRNGNAVWAYRYRLTVAARSGPRSAGSRPALRHKQGFGARSIGSVPVAAR